MPTDRRIRKHVAADLTEWEADPYGYNGGYGGKPRQHYVDATVGHAAHYNGCSHEIELTRDDLLALLKMIDEVSSDGE